MLILKKTILIVFGTRPEAIKMAPLVIALQKYPTLFSVSVCITGQHREMLDQVLTIFGIHPAYDLAIMQKSQDLYDITSKVVLGMREVLIKAKPDIVLVHGDTVTSMAASLAAFYQQIPIGHVEAGLRTHNRYSPWPEEMNRQLTGRLATYHFAPTAGAKANLLAENVNEQNILVTGNTVIDALFDVISKMESNPMLEGELSNQLLKNGYDTTRLNQGRKLVLITGHRRENFGDGFVNICNALKMLAEKYHSVDFVYPVHLNPNVQTPVYEILEDSIHKNVFLIAPLDYFHFVYLMKQSAIILTDSGGIQEEAPSLGKPVLVMRDTTERPEAVLAGTVKLVGAHTDRIVNGVSELLDNESEYQQMAFATNPYGDGKAAERIVDFLKDIQLINHNQ